MQRPRGLENHTEDCSRQRGQRGDSRGSKPWEVAVSIGLYSERDLAISGMQIDIWKSTAYKGHGTLSKEGKRRTETQGPSPRACQQAKEVEEEQPELRDNPERLNSSSGSPSLC